MSILNVTHLTKTYSTRFGGAQIQALTDVNFAVENGEFIAIMGESGSGKTTLLNILAGLDKPSSGQVFLNMKDIVSMPENEMSAFRREKIGFVFQDFNLLDTLSIEDNIYLPMVLSGRPYAEMHSQLLPLAEKLEISSLLKKFPYEVSGGQKQRTAMARAMITAPQLLMADEPTGALDSRSADNIMGLFNQLNSDGQTILMVTHSLKAASCAGRVLFIKDGQVFHQLYRGAISKDEFYMRISDTLTAISSGGERDV